MGADRAEGMFVVEEWIKTRNRMRAQLTSGGCRRVKRVIPFHVIDIERSPEDCADAHGNTEDATQIADRSKLIRRETHTNVSSEKDKTTTREETDQQIDMITDTDARLGTEMIRGTWKDGAAIKTRVNVTETNAKQGTKTAAQGARTRIVIVTGIRNGRKLSRRGRSQKGVGEDGNVDREIAEDIVITSQLRTRHVPINVE